MPRGAGTALVGWCWPGPEGHRWDPEPRCHGPDAQAGSACAGRGDRGRAGGGQADRPGGWRGLCRLRCGPPRAAHLPAKGAAQPPGAGRRVVRQAGPRAGSCARAW